MASSKLISCLFFLSSIAILVQTVNSLDPLVHICSNSLFTANSDYAQNLKNLLGDLNSKTPPTGFSTSSMGRKPDRTYGLSLCRGDVSNTDCKSCVLAASQEIGKRCPYRKEGIIWYNKCLLKYSDDCFKGEIDDTNKFIWWNSSAIANPEFIAIITKEMLGCIAEKAYNGPNFFATKEMNIVNNEKWYGLVQCTRDLSKEDCKKCLEGIISQLPISGKRGGRVVGGSCNFRFEVYPFFNTLQKLEYIMLNK
ncbi:cysteine-rich repeat secretory protein 38-like [Lycium ferocissimum]|uniref:cysteine-rich repeat secretory protein 38-like n=1 Tax=Lycium ferocissimum TaxID=112874 RepID=UPI002814AE25|nr:cysteine-rich repeat secretory protein 38-like [Lycium ferocissimum]